MKLKIRNDEISKLLTKEESLRRNSQGPVQQDIQYFGTKLKMWRSIHCVYRTTWGEKLQNIIINVLKVASTSANTQRTRPIWVTDSVRCRGLPVGMLMIKVEVLWDFFHMLLMKVLKELLGLQSSTLFGMVAISWDMFGINGPVWRGCVNGPTKGLVLRQTV